ncbi:MAG: YnfA family protein [Nitrososphaeraceae archaeon]
MGLFFVASVAEIGGGYLIWKWIREHRNRIYGILGAFILFVYGIILTFQPETFGRVYATYGGIFIISSLLWGIIIEKKKLDKFEIMGSLIIIIGISIIFYAPR